MPHAIPFHILMLIHCYDFSHFALFTYVFSLFLEVSHGAAALTHFSLTHIAATLLTHELTLVGASRPARGFAPGKLNDFSSLINKLV